LRRQVRLLERKVASLTSAQGGNPARRWSRRDRQGTERCQSNDKRRHKPHRRPRRVLDKGIVIEPGSASRRRHRPDHGRSPGRRGVDRNLPQVFEPSLTHARSRPAIDGRAPRAVIAENAALRAQIAGTRRGARRTETAPAVSRHAALRTAVPAPGQVDASDASDRLKLAEALLGTDDLATCASARWTGSAARRRHARPLSRRVAGHPTVLEPIAHSRARPGVQSFTARSQAQDDPLVAASIGGRSEHLRGNSRPAPRTPLESGVHRSPLHARQTLEEYPSACCSVARATRTSRPRRSGSRACSARALPRCGPPARLEGEPAAFSRATLLYNIINAVSRTRSLTDTEGRITVANARAEALLSAGRGESEVGAAIALNNMLFSWPSPGAPSRAPSRGATSSCCDPIDGSTCSSSCSAPSPWTRPRARASCPSPYVTDLRRATRRSRRKLSQAAAGGADARAERDASTSSSTRWPTRSSRHRPERQHRDDERARRAPGSRPIAPRREGAARCRRTTRTSPRSCRTSSSSGRDAAAAVPSVSWTAHGRPPCPGGHLRQDRVGARRGHGHRDHPARPHRRAWSARAVRSSSSAASSELEQKVARPPPS